jgi:flagellar hook-associated protein 2
MGGITSSVGIFSGINSASLIDQLLAIEARPKTLAQNRMVQIQGQQAAYLDISSRITALKNAAAGFRDNKTFLTKSTTSSNESVLKATADTTAAAGNYTFVVDRLVSTQQALSRGFANKDISGLGGTSISIESSKARLDRDVELSDLNDGQGVSRGRIVITDSASGSATIDLSRATSVNDVLEAINSNGTAQVTASVSGGKFIITDNRGGSLTVANGQGSTMATSLGLAGVSASGGKVTGNTVYRMSGATTLASLNDGNGVSVKASTTESSYNFQVRVTNGATTTTVNVNLSDIYEDVNGTTTKTDGAVSDLSGVVSRINTALSDAGFTNIAASVDSDNNRLQIVDSTSTRTLQVIEGSDTTAADLGLASPITGSSLFGKRVLAGLQTTMAGGLTGFAAATHDGLVNFKLRNGAEFTASVDTTTTVQEMLAGIEDASAVSGVKRVSATLDSKGTGIIITDLTSGSGNLFITGTTGNDAAAALGISTGALGQSGASKSSGNLQRQYMSRATLLSGLNGGKGVGTGDFRITDSSGASATVKVTDTVKSMGDLIDLINSRGLKVKASVNANGDGLVIKESLGSGEPAGTLKVKIEEVSGTIAKNLNILGTATDVGSSNYVDGSFERKVTLTTADTLQQTADKINAAKAGVTASVVRDGSGSAPFRLNITSTQSGTSGRFVLDSGTLDLGLSTLDAGRDARIFFGSNDAATGVAVTSSTNTIDSILQGVKIDLKSVGTEPVNLTVASDTGGIESTIQTFINTFNTAIGRIETQTKYDKDTEKKAPLLGDGTMLELRSQLFATIQGSNRGSAGTYTTLADVGIKIGTGGSLTLDSGKLREALAADPASVEALFTARTAVDDRFTDLGDGIRVRNTASGSTFSTLSVVGQIEQLAKRYVDGTSAVLFSRQDQLRNQVTLQETRIASLDDRLAQRRQILQTQFVNMEKAIGQLQSQQGALSSIGKAG